MSEEDFSIHIYCSYCGKGELLADRRAKVRISMVCPVCGRVNIVHLYHLKSFRLKEEPVKKKRPLNQKLSCPCAQCDGRIDVDGWADVRVSVKCPKKHKDGSGRYFIADLSNGETYPSHPVRKKGRKK